MTQFEIKDNSINNKEAFSQVSHVTQKVADKTLEQLGKEGIFVFPELLKASPDMTGDQMILQSVNDCYRSSNIMGFIGYGDERLVISSRFSSGDDFFLNYLLEHVLDFPNVIDMETDSNQDNRLFNLLIFLFPVYLKNAMRKGVFKTYTYNKYNDSNVKGTIDIARHIKVNTPFIGNIAYNKREYSYDNYLTELIRHTIEYIKRKPYGKTLLKNVKDEVKLIINITGNYEHYDRLHVIADNKRNVVRHAFYHEYRALQQLCILILNHRKHQIGFGSCKIYGILFDSAWLWEEYVASLLENDFYHPMNKKGSGAQYLFTDNRVVGMIYPDFISRSESERVIADAKYKPADNIGNKDYLQVLAYMYRFDAKRGFYLFPQSVGQDAAVLWMNEGVSYEGNVRKREDVCVIKHGLKIPNNAKNYSDFTEQMKVSEAEFIEKIHMRRD